MNELFNTSFETGLRVLLLLSSIQPQAASVDRITAYDFITLYSKDFEISSSNLHGDNKYNFSELAYKRAKCNEGIKEFVLKGLIEVKQTQKGFTYYLSQAGQKYVEKLSSDYKTKYLEIIEKVAQKYTNKTDEEIINLINRKAISELRGSKA